MSVVLNPGPNDALIEIPRSRDARRIVRAPNSPNDPND